MDQRRTRVAVVGTGFPLFVEKPLVFELDQADLPA
jgi:hypothetical protein